MVDEIKLKLIKTKPTFDEIASPKMSNSAKVVFRVAMQRSCDEQTRMLRRTSGR